jgi:hypothetical protein
MKRAFWAIVLQCLLYLVFTVIVCTATAQKQDEKWVLDAWLVEKRYIANRLIECIGRFNDAMEDANKQWRRCLIEKDGQYSVDLIKFDPERLRYKLQAARDAMDDMDRALEGRR